MPKYLFTNVYNYDNQGEMAQVTSLVRNLKGKFAVVPICSTVDTELCERLGIEVKGRTKPLHKALFLMWLGFFILRSILYKVYPWSFLLNRELRAYRDCDMILDLSGDTFSDEPSPLQSIFHCAQLLPAIFMCKPYVLVSQSIGIFKTAITKRLAKYVLSHAQRIIARENITARYLVQELGIETGKVSCALDVAVLLETAKVPMEGKYIGVNVSQIIGKRMRSSEDYILLMVGLVDTLAKDKMVLLIPHVTGTGYALGKSKVHDDRIIAHEIYEMVTNKDNVRLINDVYNAEYTKGIIGHCSFFVGARFHACISAISQGIPTLVLAYSQKSVGMVNQIGLPWVSVVDLRNKNLFEIDEEIKCLIPK